jgi:hypothetical protein
MAAQEAQTQTIDRLRSRILYLHEEDANTSFFHQQARFRKKKDFIAKLQVGGRLTSSQEDKQAVLQFYDKLLGKAEERKFSISFLSMTVPLRMKSGQPLEIYPLMKRLDQMVLHVDFTSDAGI